LQLVQAWRKTLPDPIQREFLYDTLLDHVESGTYQFSVSRGGSHQFKWMNETCQRQLVDNLSIFSDFNILLGLWDSRLKYLKEEGTRVKKLEMRLLLLPPTPPPPPQEGDGT
jgi:hypothetical protein